MPENRYGLLRDQADPRPQLSGSSVAHVDPADEHRAPVASKSRGHQVDQGGLAGAGQPMTATVWPGSA